MTGGEIVMAIAAAYLVLGSISAVIRYELIVAAVDELVEETRYLETNVGRRTWLVCAVLVHFITWPFFFARDSDA